MRIEIYISSSLTHFSHTKSSFSCWALNFLFLLFISFNIFYSLQLIIILACKLWKDCKTIASRSQKSTHHKLSHQRWRGESETTKLDGFEKIIRFRVVAFFSLLTYWKCKCWWSIDLSFCGLTSRYEAVTSLLTQWRN